MEDQHEDYSNSHVSTVISITTERRSYMLIVKYM